MNKEDKNKIILIEADRNSKLLNSIIDLASNENHNELGKLLSNLHNEEKINLLSDQNIKAISDLEHYAFWGVRDHLIGAIETLNDSYQNILIYVETLVNKAGNDDLSKNIPYSNYITWCSLNPDVSREILNDAKGQKDEGLRAASFALHGLGEFANVIAFMDHESPNIHTIGFQVLGFWSNLSATNTQEGLDRCNAAILLGKDNNLRSAAIEATFRLWDKEGLKNKALQDSIINNLLKEPSNDELVLLCALLYYCPNASSEQTITKILRATKRLTSYFDVVAKHIDDALNTRDDRWSFPEVVSFYEFLIPKLAKPSTHDELNNFCGWVKEKPDNISFLFASWLNKGDSSLCKFLTEIPEWDYEKNLEVNISREHLPKSASDQIFAARKCIGYLWFYPITAASILLSIIRNGNKEARKTAEQLLWYPLLLSYHDRLKTYLEAQKENKSKRISTAVSTLLDQQLEYLSGLEHAHEINELEPSTTARRAVVLKDYKRNAEIQKIARDHSPILKLAHQSTLLYGSNCLALVSDGEGTISPNIFPMVEFSGSIEIPMLEVVDPMGINKLLIYCKAVKKDL